ncbi:lantibiotic dehydratase [Parafrankia sp. FMc6]|uniref:lantibiotic dehydratase n=1 Tax=Parafrankia soli TaxID=2599596 RepID=UPI0034D62844
MLSASSPGFRCAQWALVRATGRSWSELPAWPDLTELSPDAVPTWVGWLRQVWQLDGISEALDHASPILARRVRDLCATEMPPVRETWRAVVSTGRYLLRMEGRATPFGLLAGVAPASFGADVRTSLGDQGQVVIRAGAEWLAEIIAQLEECTDLLARLPVIANSTLMVRGDRLIVPYQARMRERGTGAVEVSLRNTAAVRAAVRAVLTPITAAELSARLLAEFPEAAPARVTAMLAELVACRALITGLHAPSTQTDALGHLLLQLDAAEAVAVTPVAGLVATLREIHAHVEKHNHGVRGDGRAVRAEVSARMSRLARTRRHPLAVDLRLDGQVELPTEVAREVERAVLVLTRLSAHPGGTPVWRDYHQRFYERFGVGSLVPVLDVVADSGIGWPDGYPGTVTPPRRLALSARDEALLALAQGAVLDGWDEVIVDEALIEAVALDPGPLRPPPPLELGVRIGATDEDALRRGDFRLEVTTVSRGAGVLTGRFLGVLAPEGRGCLTATLAGLPCGDEGTVAAQLSFAPLDPATAHVTRTPQIHPLLITLGEHRAPDEQVLTVEDLAVGCDGRRMYLAAPAHGVRVEATASHALALPTHTPPLARFLTELSRANYAQVTTFDWGAASRLPFLPRVRVGRTILAPARWTVTATELPSKAASWTTWDSAFASWRTRRQLPRRVRLVEGDQLLPLDLDQAGHRVLLRTHLGTAPRAVLSEAPDPADAGWCGGRAHEVVVPLSATAPPPWPRLPTPTRARVIRRGHGDTPAASAVLLACLYGDLDRQNTILTDYLPGLLVRLQRERAFVSGPAWWFVRYRDPDQHLRLRIALPDPGAFAEAARIVSCWAAELHRDGVLREVRYPVSYPETGRWGSGPAWEAAQAVFGADSRALLAQLALPRRPSWQVLVAAHTVAITRAFTGSAATAMRWLIDHVPAAAPTRVPRTMFAEAVRLADPGQHWAALRAAPGGALIVDAWAARDRALADYRAHFPGPDTEGVAVDDVLSSLIHVHFVRAHRIDFDDEAIAMYLARAAALAWTARARADGSHR